MSYALCLHRWVGTQALYGQYALPAGMTLRAICTPEAVSSLPRGRVASRNTLASMDDDEAVMAETAMLIEQHGPPALVVALNEGDLLNAAAIRERWRVPGDTVASVSRFRDKLAMLDVASAQRTVRVLPAVDADSREAVTALASEHGYPLVFKPRYGTASRGVTILRAPGDLDLLERASEPMMVQVYCDAPVVHVDGWWDGQQIIVATVSRYVNTCSEFGLDSPLGSIELEEGEDERRIAQDVKPLLAAFAPHREIVFHLELFDHTDGLSFLEIGARVGGAEIPFLWREVRDIDLLAIAWELQTGASTCCRERARILSIEGRPRHRERGAWVIARRGFSLREDLETLYWAKEHEPKREASGVYEGAPTRLRLRSFDRQALVRDVKKIFEHLSDPRSVQP